MKCANCGAELKVGCVYCSVCGKEAQIVPDYNILEDDFLKSLLNEEEKGTKKKEEEKKKSSKKETPKKKKKSKMPLIISGIFVAIAIIAIIIVVVINNNHKNSFDYQYTQGIACEEQKDYTKAIDYFKHALTLDNDNKDVLLELAKIYEIQGDDTSEEATLLELIVLDTSNESAYQMLITLYDKNKEYDKITNLYENLKDSSLKSLFNDYIVVSPTFDPEAGDYDDYMTVSITKTNDDIIYYTTDGTDPIKYGDVYQNPLEIDKEGITTIQAVACDDRGIYSDIVSAKYNIKFVAPKSATVSPTSGSFTEAAGITINVPEGCNAYYTWDGTAPTAASAHYEGPIEMPEGNNVLAIIIIDKHDLVSVVAKFNYIYMP